jgi:predicted XRE-type DNA-binding protein
LLLRSLNGKRCVGKAPDMRASIPHLKSEMWGTRRSSLMLALKRHIEREGLSQTEAARVFGVTQPRISDLMRGKIELFGIDMLVNMLAAAGLRVTLQVKKAA